MEFKGNKGEWKILHYNCNGFKSTEIHFGNDGECVAEHVANEHDAKLIAAAPELLEACVKSYDLARRTSMPTEKELVEQAHYLYKAIKKALT